MELQKQEKRVYPKFLFKLQDVEFPERFNSRQFGAYKHPKTFKTTYLLNADGRSVESGLIVTSLNLLFDVSRIDHAEIVRFLMNNPENVEMGGEGFTLTDIEKEAQNLDTDLINELQLESKIMLLDLRKLKAVASSLRINYNLTKTGLQASIIRRVRTAQSIGGKKTEPGYISVARVVDAKKTMILLDVTQMLEYSIITINNSGIYAHGNHNLGLNPDQVVLYFEKEPALHGLLKTELREKLSEDGKLDDGKEPLDLNLS
jgi:hypothetical protein